MKKSAIFLALALVILSSCGEDEEVRSTKLLTSKTWGKPQILKMPDNIGFWSGTTCKESYHYSSERNNYTRNDDCVSFTINGKWSWTKIGEELFIDYLGNMPYNHKIKIVQLSDTLFHTIERDEHESDKGTGNYWEKKYRPRF